jgi:hypothetical protein
MRLLGGGENPPMESGRELNKCKDLIELAALQGGLIAPIPETQDELSCTSGHINQDNV